MPRPTPPRRGMTMPEVKPKPIYRADRRGFARMLGLDLMPDECVQGIAFIIAAHRASQQVAEGHTPARAAATLRCVEGRVRRGHDGPEATREITDPLFGIDAETFERLSSCINDPATPTMRYGWCWRRTRWWSGGCSRWATTTACDNGDLFWRSSRPLARASRGCARTLSGSGGILGDLCS